MPEDLASYNQHNTVSTSCLSSSLDPPWIWKHCGMETFFQRTFLGVGGADFYCIGPYYTQFLWMCGCGIVLPFAGDQDQESWELKTKNPVFQPILGFWNIFPVLFWWTSILCIVGELAGSVRVAVGVGDRWQVTGYVWYILFPKLFRFFWYLC